MEYPVSPCDMSSERIQLFRGEEPDSLLPGHVRNGRISGMMKQEPFISLTSASFAHGWKDIGAAFGESSRIARQWADEGAPVIMVTPSIPCVCLGKLWERLKDRGRNQPSPLPEKDAPRGPERRETGKDESEEAQNEKINLEGYECPYCASVGTMRRNGKTYRCEWCRQSFTGEEMGES